jgi:hypothetical protein
LYRRRYLEQPRTNETHLEQSFAQVDVALLNQSLDYLVIHGLGISSRLANSIKKYGRDAIGLYLEQAGILELVKMVKRKYLCEPIANAAVMRETERMVFLTRQVSSPLDVKLTHTILSGNFFGSERMTQRC